MTESFKQQLQALVNEAAEKSVNRNMLELREADARVRHFKQGCEFLIPVLMRAIEQRDHFIALYDDFAKQERNKQLLSILKGEGK